MIVVTLVGVLPVSIFLTVPAAHAMVRFSSFSELERFLLTRSTCSYQNPYGRSMLYGASNQLAASPAPLSPGSNLASDSVSSTPSHSETNDQVSGVDELDTVKTDGEYIYTVSNNTVVIVEAYPVTNARLVSRISLANQTIDGIFFEDNRLSIVSEAPRNPYSGGFYCGYGNMGITRTWGAFPATSLCRCYWPSQVQNTTISVYDLTDRSSPTLKTMVTVNGTFIGARLIGQYAYLVASTPARYNQTLPLAVVNGQAVKVQATQIYHSDVSDSAFSYTTVVALHTTEDNTFPTIETYLLGTSGTIYVSLTNIFLTQPVWSGVSDTVIHRISVDSSTVKYEASGIVPGHVLNQFSMDEYGAYFRIATTIYGGWHGGTSGVYVLDRNLQTVGRIEGLGQNEYFHSARFVEDTAYLVTFKKTDPLFVVGLADPTRPRLLGQLNVTGYSDYLQPFDASHLIGIGKDTVDEGSFAWYQGVKISLFDVSDPAKPAETANYVIGDRGSDSPALRDGKAVLLDPGKDLLVIPVQVDKSPDPRIPNAYGTPVWQGAYVFQVTIKSLTFRGGITHLPNVAVPYPVASVLTITRTLYIGNVLYTISEGMIGVTDLSSLQSVGSISLL